MLKGWAMDKNNGIFVYYSIVFNDFCKLLWIINLWLLIIYFICKIVHVYIMKFIDLFAGLSGIRIGLEYAAQNLGINAQCALTAEVKPIAIEALKHRYPGEKVDYDVYNVHADLLPNGADIILGGFPCQPFSAAGKGLGFMDTRGTLFFEIERIIKELTDNGHKPKGFILENVEGLIRHGGTVAGSQYGRTLNTIINKLRLAGYNVDVALLDAADFGVPQSRKRVYIVGVDNSIGKIDLTNLPTKKVIFADVQERGLPTEKSDFTRLLLKKYKPTEITGKYIKDKRGGKNNIHSWDLEARGPVTEQQKNLLNILLKERRKKKWAKIIGIDWMDGMPLTVDQIATFFPIEGLQDMLDDLVNKGYLVFEYPKKKVILRKGVNVSYSREADTSKAKGYNIVTGKLSFEFCQFLDPNTVAPTMVAMDMDRIGVVDGDGVRHLTINEGLKLFGYKDYDLSYLEKRKGGRKVAFDLLGNSVCVPVIQIIADRLLKLLINNHAI